MMEFQPKVRKAALTVHILCCGTWMGSAIAMGVLIVWLGRSTDSDSAFAATWMAIKLIDDFVIIPSAVASFVTGCVMSWGTKWGFFKWRWIVAKIFATTALIAFGVIVLGPWVNVLAANAAEFGLDALKDPGFHQTYWGASVFGGIQALGIATVFAVSVFKPWGRMSTDQLIKLIRQAGKRDVHRTRRLTR